MVSSIPELPAKVKIANTISFAPTSAPFSICFMNSSSGVWSGAKRTFTGTPARPYVFGTSTCRWRPKLPAGAG